MRVLFDHGTPAPLARALDGHDVRFARSEGWDTFSNGALLAAAEAGGFHVPYLEEADVAEALSYAAWRAEEVEVPLGQP